MNCKRCGTPVPSNRLRSSTCSRECYHRSWVEANRGKLNEAVRKYRANRYAKEGCWRDSSPKSSALKAWMNEIKSRPCVDCGGRFEICCMDFDHKDGTAKEYNVGSMFAHHYSRELIEKELVKCELVCSNCHRVRTRNRRTGSGKHGIRGVAKDGTTVERDDNL